ncbi:hypothetical protein R3P38DRAFT_2796682 [Favolaschia claudopus]|uniref:Uncharacterized protein n=1 Tax=Favolaschia claudopus TaxID=2862362 RepID=A0AAW0A3W1_9AGAR
MSQEALVQGLCKLMAAKPLRLGRTFLVHVQRREIEGRECWEMKVLGCLLIIIGLVLYGVDGGISSVNRAFGGLRDILYTRERRNPTLPRRGALWCTPNYKAYKLKPR